MHLKNKGGINMLYYRVVKPDKVFRFNHYLQTIKNELFTPAEVRQYKVPDKQGCCLKDEWLEPVNIKKFGTYWFFGARLEATAE